MKSYLDYGAFTPIQAAACAALNGPQDIIDFNLVRLALVENEQRLRQAARGVKKKMAGA